MAVIRATYTPAWDAGARTIAGLTGDGRFSFSVGSVIGVVCGFSTQDVGVTYGEITHGFYLTPSGVRVIERGVFKTAFASYDAEAVFALERTGTVVRYYIDEVLIYTSTKLSEGVVYGDCSLFFYLDSILNATITPAPDRENTGSAGLPLGAFGVEGDWNQGLFSLGTLQSAGEECAVLTLGSLSAQGVEGDANWGHAGLGPLAVTTTDDLSTAWLTLGALWAKGAEGDPNWGRVTLGPVTAAGWEEVLLPEYNAGAVWTGPVYAYGYEGTVDTATGDITCGALWAKGAESDPNWGNAAIGPVSAFGYSLRQQYLNAEWPEWTAEIIELVAPSYAVGDIQLTWPSRTLFAEGEDRDATATLTWPTRTLTAYGGGSAKLTWPTRTLTVAGTLESVGKAELTWPTWALTATGLTGGLGAAELTWPARALSAYGGGTAKLTWPARTLTVAGTLEIVGTGAVRWPRWILTATGLTGGVGTAELTWPTRTLAAEGWTGGVGAFALRWPTRILTATGSGGLTETTYAINLTSGAVTQLLLGAFDKLVTAHGRLYGLREGVLFYLGGTTDQGTEIPVTLRFAPQQFGTYQAKRLDGHVYLNTREDDGITLTLVQDETTAWTYQTATDTAPAMGTHRVKIGRGITFHSLGLTLNNRAGGRLDVGGLELPIYPLSRRPK